MSMSTRQIIGSWSAAAIAVILFIAQHARTQAPSEVDNLTPSCTKRLNIMFAKYTAPTAWTDECDPTCLMQCSETLYDAIYSTTSKDCPVQANITGCFKVRFICRRATSFQFPATIKRRPQTQLLFCPRNVCRYMLMIGKNTSWIANSSALL